MLTLQNPSGGAEDSGPSSGPGSLSDLSVVGLAIVVVASVEGLLVPGLANRPSPLWAIGGLAALLSMAGDLMSTQNVEKDFTKVALQLEKIVYIITDNT